MSLTLLLILITVAVLIIWRIIQLYVSRNAIKLSKIISSCNEIDIKKVMADINADQRDLDFAMTLCEDTKKVKACLEAGANPNRLFGPSSDYFTAVTASALEGKPEILQVYLDHGISSNTQIDGGIGMSVLQYACLGGNLACVKLLCERGADVNYINGAGHFPILYAATCGHLEIVKYLSNNGADMKKKDNDGRTALDWARNAINSDEQRKAISSLRATLNESQLDEVVKYIKTRTSILDK